jgi:hypothetical protein
MARTTTALATPGLLRLAQHLRERGLGAREIVEEIRRRKGITISRSTASYWSRGIVPTRTVLQSRKSLNADVRTLKELLARLEPDQRAEIVSLARRLAGRRRKDASVQGERAAGRQHAALPA